MPERKHTRTFRSKKLNADHVKLLNECIRKNVKGGDLAVHIKYHKPDGTVSERRIKPLGVKDKSLLLAHCHDKDALRSFRLERISMIKSASTALGRHIAKGVCGGAAPKEVAGDVCYQSVRKMLADGGRVRHFKKDVESIVRASRSGDVIKKMASFWDGFEKRATSFMQSGIDSLHNAFGGGASAPTPPPPPPPPASTSSKGARISAGFKGVM